MSAPCDVLCVVGARPNFIKMAPILAAFAAQPAPLRVGLVHTGQHYGEAMDRQIFSALGMREADVNLDVGSASHAQQTALVMQRFEPVLAGARARAVLVVGDVNSTLACALVAAKMAVPVVHVEAGLRSFDRAMPEEINRLLTDQLSSLLLTSEPSGLDNLLREGIARSRIHEVGNVMIDSLQNNLRYAVPLAQLLARQGRAGLLGRPGGYAVVTVHRPSNVDDAASLRRTLELVAAVATRLPVVFPMHPRTRAMVAEHDLEHLLAPAALFVCGPLGYLEMLGAMKQASVVITDSGGLQEEALVLGVPCITLRESTERPATVACGGNVLVGQHRAMALAALDRVLAGQRPPGAPPALWDGHAAERIAHVTRHWLLHLERR